MGVLERHYLFSLSHRLKCWKVKREEDSVPPPRAVNRSVYRLSGGTLRAASEAAHATLGCDYVVALTALINSPAAGSPLFISLTFTMFTLQVYVEMCALVVGGQAV